MFKMELDDDIQPHANPDFFPMGLSTKDASDYRYNVTYPRGRVSSSPLMEDATSYGQAEESFERFANDSSSSSSSQDIINFTSVFPGNMSLPIDMQFNDGHILQISCYSGIFIVSLIGNLCVLRAILGGGRKQRKSRVNLMLLHLAIADLIVTITQALPLDTVIFEGLSTRSAFARRLLFDVTSESEKQRVYKSSDVTSNSVCRAKLDCVDEGAL
ncbi:uncharacterized protein LOC135209522 [Macrobrachium nipponense]|uniref:uncharacterized protein LOC135209522 n=1 Tax=Macrobrachium nipponense TaxID=159736 RepID=UPI0030C88B0E